MQLFLSLLVLVCFVSLATAYVKTTAFASRAIASHLAAIEYDSQGYVIKPRDWFNGLSGDPGASLTDPRAVPAEAKSFAEAIKAGTKQVTLAETLALIDAHYNYFEVRQPLLPSETTTYRTQMWCMWFSTLTFHLLQHTHIHTHSQTHRYRCPSCAVR
jgi:hypothetical protein